MRRAVQKAKCYFGLNNKCYNYFIPNNVRYTTNLESGVDRPYNGPRRFAKNGEVVNDDTIFKVSFKEWNEYYVLPNILRGREYCLLTYPNQSGKTSRIVELMNQLKGLQCKRRKSLGMNQLELQKEGEIVNEAEYDKDIQLLPLYVDMKVILSASGDSLHQLSQSAWKLFIEALNRNSGQISCFNFG